MSDMILVYITCATLKQAKQIGTYLMQKRLCACVNIFPEMLPMVFWPPKSNSIATDKEVVLIVKTVESKYKALEKEVEKIHTYDVPCIFSIPVTHVSKSYYDWLTGELKEPTLRKNRQ